MSEPLPAIVASALSAISFAIAISLGFRLADVRGLQRRRAGESRAALAAGIGVILLLVAVILWVSYLIFGPIHDYVSELVNPGGGD
jgi:O-antigen/teichoic acid export membrane protein